MLYRPSSFRKTAFAMTAVAAIAGASVLASFPANAQQVVNASTCDAIKNNTAAIKCEIKQADDRIKAANERGAQVDVMQGCANFLKSGITKGDFTQAKMLQTGGGKVDKGNICDVARMLGYDRRAELANPALK